MRRYLRSPYASQFADAFIDGIMGMHASIDRKAIEEIVAGMDTNQQKFIYLRLARRSAIDGMSDLSAFASQNAERTGDEEKSQSDPRAELYSSLATMTTETVGDVLARLKAIDRERLSENDRRLLEAAEAIAAEMTSIPGRPVSAAAGPALVETDNGDVANEPLPPAETAPTVPIAAEVENPQVEAAVAEADTPPDAAEATVSEARKKLDAVDKLLGETAE